MRGAAGDDDDKKDLFVSGLWHPVRGFQRTEKRGVFFARFISYFGKAGDWTMAPRYTPTQK